MNEQGHRTVSGEPRSQEMVNKKEEEVAEGRRVSGEREGISIIIILYKNSYALKSPGNSLAVQWLGLCTFTAEGPGSIPGWETKIPHSAWPKIK